MPAAPHSDVIVLGAGAAGLMCAIEAAKRGRRVLILEGANKPGKKILMSGGGRCNFTNLNVSPDKYSSHNPHFCKSALKRYTQWDFIDKVESYRIPYYEKTLGQLFCKDKAKDILNMLLTECNEFGAELKLKAKVERVEQCAQIYKVHTEAGVFSCHSLVVATGGLSIPTLGSTPIGYQIAEHFEIPVFPLNAGLVPLTLHAHDLQRFAPLTGLSQHAKVTVADISFEESLLFTHRGLSGPVILQCSSYWRPGEAITVDWLPQHNFEQIIADARRTSPKQHLKNLVHNFMPMRLVDVLIAQDLQGQAIGQLRKSQISMIVQALHHTQIRPNATEGYRTAEVTLGGVDCNALSSKTMESLKRQGLYFIGEVVDVTGWLGGYNFQWAWSSGFVAGQVV